MLEKLLTILTALVEAVKANTAAQGGKAPVGKPAAGSKPETAAQKKARIAKEKRANKGKAATKASVKEKAKNICVAISNEIDKPAGKMCAGQIKELVAEVAVELYSDGAVTLADFDDDGVATLDKALDSFTYQPEAEAEEADDIEL
jgi:hypothetical protein